MTAWPRTGVRIPAVRIRFPGARACGPVGLWACGLVGLWACGPVGLPVAVSRLRSAAVRPAGRQGGAFESYRGNGPGRQGTDDGVFLSDVILFDAEDAGDSMQTSKDIIRGPWGGRGCRRSYKDASAQRPSAPGRGTRPAQSHPGPHPTRSTR